MSYELDRSLEVVEEGMYVCGAIALVGVYSDTPSLVASLASPETGIIFPIDSIKCVKEGNIHLQREL